MTDEELADQLHASTRSLLKRYYADEPATDAEHQAMHVAAYLTGVSQATTFLAARDGEVTAQQLSRACFIVGKRIGFTLDQPT